MASHLPATTDPNTKTFLEEQEELERQSRQLQDQLQLKDDTIAHADPHPDERSAKTGQAVAVAGGNETEGGDEGGVTRVIVVAVDQSKHSENALNWALKNIINPATDFVVLINVRPSPVIPGPAGTVFLDYTDFIVKLDAQSRHEAHTLLKRYAALVNAKKVAVKAIAMRGDAREEIRRKIVEVDADLVVVGSRGMGLVKRAFLGSVSDYLVHHVACPTLIIKDKE